MRGEKPHHQRRGVPAAGDQPAKEAVRCRRGVGVHGLWVVAPRELDNIALADRDRAALEYRAWRVVLEIARVCFCGHAARGSGKSITCTSSLVRSSTAQLSWRPLRWSRASPAEPGLITNTLPIRRRSGERRGGEEGRS